jgi:hypothetical protein
MAVAAVGPAAARAPRPQKAPRQPRSAGGGRTASATASAPPTAPPSPTAADAEPLLEADDGLLVLGAAAATLDVPLEEAHIPRWRRPSLRAARQMSDRYPAAARAALRFREPTADGEDRRQVAYRLVRVGSEPDEFSGEEVGRIDRGDEVQVLETEGAYCRIQAPDGITGWIHRTTLQAEEIREDGAA